MEKSDSALIAFNGTDLEVFGGVEVGDKQCHCEH